MSDDNDDDNLSEKLRELSSDPSKGVRRLRKSFATFERSMTEELYTYLAMAFATFFLVRMSADLKQIIIDELKPKSNKLNDKRLLLLVLRYLLKAPAKGAIYDRARVYAMVLEAEFDKGTDAADIPNAIRAGGGIEKLYEAQAEKKRLQKAEVASGATEDGDEEDDETDSPGSENEGDGDGAGGDQDVDDDDDDDSITLGGGVTGGAPSPKPAPKTPQRIPFNPKTDLVVRCETEAQLIEVLESKVKSGLFHVEFRYKDDGMVELLLRDWDSK